MLNETHSLVSYWTGKGRRNTKKIWWKDSGFYWLMREWREAIAATGWIVQETKFTRTTDNAHVPYHHHRHHHLAIFELDQLLTSSGFTHLEVSSKIFPGFFCILVCSFFFIFGNLLRGILFTLWDLSIQYNPNYPDWFGRRTIRIYI